jgi:hypothetical protein
MHRRGCNPPPHQILQSRIHALACKGEDPRVLDGIEQCLIDQYELCCLLGKLDAGSSL